MLRYFIVDVFTDRALTGNALAIVLDAGALTTNTMQAIAREFNLSDTVFVTGPVTPHVPVRIFTSKSEVPFAGHPVIGVSLLVSSLLPDRSKRDIFLETIAGLIHCQAAAQDGWASFQSPKLPTQVHDELSADRLAALMGLTRKAIGAGGHTPSIFGAGLDIAFVPVANAEMLSQIHILPEQWEAALPAPLPRLLAAYTLTPGRALQYRFRAFAPLLGTTEDPATGAAAAAFGGVLARFERLPDGLHSVEILQGHEMARPSRINLEVAIEKERVTNVNIRGQAIVLAEGTLRVQ